MSSVTVLSGIERRRRRSSVEKARIVEESLGLGRSSRRWRIATTCIRTFRMPGAGKRIRPEPPNPRGPLKRLNALQRLAESLERAKGFEPSTPTLARSCSTPELRPRSDPAG
jgi:hypothetical protein